MGLEVWRRLLCALSSEGAAGRSSENMDRCLANDVGVGSPPAANSRPSLLGGDADSLASAGAAVVAASASSRCRRRWVARDTCAGRSRSAQHARDGQRNLAGKRKEENNNSVRRAHTRSRPRTCRGRRRATGGASGSGNSNANGSMPPPLGNTAVAVGPAVRGGCRSDGPDMRVGSGRSAVSRGADRSRRLSSCFFSRCSLAPMGRVEAAWLPYVAGTVRDTTGASLNQSTGPARADDAPCSPPHNE